MSQPKPTPSLRERAGSYALAFAELNVAAREGKTPRSQRALLAHLRTEEAAGRVPHGFAKFYRGYYAANAEVSLSAPGMWPSCILWYAVSHGCLPLSSHNVIGGHRTWGEPGRISMYGKGWAVLARYRRYRGVPS
ncbi:hypothetical protein CspeluHIS016_0106550 [Cutaneotrichosporon spelunceum]|uniref:Uncharacterized protein n=1 Tax=Cutaneotrichosporon spelunceum TaxID=1672016 RepID=A0AAD3Y9V4_9TREE|nr:hypothetical protein CspeluHIS016_0106550 [Cutaneotrichosporon spelunceum]